MELDYSQDEINIDYGDGETEGRDKVESNTNNQEEGGPLVSQSFGSECRTAAASFVQVSMFLCKGDHLHQYKTAR